MLVHHSSKYEGLVDESSKDPKLAMRDCERRLKKAPNDPAIILYKVHLLVKQRLYEQAHQLAVELSKRTGIAHDLGFIRELLELDRLCAYGLGNEPDGTAASILGKQSDGLQSAFGVLLSLGYWEAAETAAINLQKGSAKDKQRQNVRFLTSQIYASSRKKLDPTAAQMRERLVKAMLKKAVQSSTLSTTQELRFYIELYLDQGDHEAALELLDHSKCGLYSSLGKGDIEFIRIKLLCLRKLLRWEQIKDFCFEIIKPDRLGEETANQLRQWTFDWNVWEHLVDALAVLHHEDPGFRLDELLQTLVPELNLDSSKSRVIWVAKMKFASFKRPADSASRSEGLLSVCTSYLDSHHAKRYCFDDLRRFAALLDHDNVQALLRASHDLSTKLSAIPKRWGVSELNSLKLEFQLLLSQTPEPDARLVSSFVASTLRFIHLLISTKVEDEYLSESAFTLAAAGLQRLSRLVKFNTGTSREVIQVIMLLEYALLDQNVPKSFRARVSLITLYRRLGCVSLSMHHYQELRIREIQNDTISHLLYQRLSVIHPLIVDNAEMRRLKLDSAVSTPMHGLQKAIDWYDVSANRTDTFLSVPVDRLRYDKVQEFMNLKERLRNSQQRQLITLERRRIARITDKSYDETDNKIDFLSPVWAQGLTDSRDFTEGLDLYGQENAQWEPQDIASSDAARHYIALMTEADATQSLLHVKDPGVEYRNSLIRLTHATQAKQAASPPTSPLLAREEQQHTFLQRLRPLILVATLGDKPEFSSVLTVRSEKEVESLIAEASAMVSSSASVKPDPDTKEWPLPTEQRIMEQCGTLDCLKSIAKLADLLGANTKQKTHVLYRKVKADIVEKLKKQTLTRADEMRSAIQQWKSHVKSNWRILYDPLALNIPKDGSEEVNTELAKLIDQRFLMDRVAASIRDSAVETLDSLSRINTA